MEVAADYSVDELADKNYVCSQLETGEASTSVSCDGVGSGKIVCIR
jgi:hypothetical protein